MDADIVAMAVSSDARDGRSTIGIQSKYYFMNYYYSLE